MSSKDWAKIKNKETGDVYYFNSATGETSWDKPAVLSWKIGVTPDGQTYYYNKTTKQSTFDKPDGVDFPPPKKSKAKPAAPAAAAKSASVAEAARLSAQRKSAQPEPVPAGEEESEGSTARENNPRSGSLHLPLPAHVRKLLSSDGGSEGVTSAGESDEGAEDEEAAEPVVEVIAEQATSPQKRAVVASSTAPAASPTTKAAAARSAARKQQQQQTTAEAAAQKPKKKKRVKARGKLAAAWQKKQEEKPERTYRNQEADILESLRQKKGRTNALTNLVTLDKEKQEMLAPFFTGEAEGEDKSVNQLVDILKMVKSLPPDAADLSKYLDRLIKDWIIEAVRATGKEISDADVDAMCNSIQDVFKSEPVKTTMQRILKREKEHPTKLVKVTRRVPVKGATKAAKPKKPKKKMRRKKVKVMVAPPLAPAAAPKLVRPDYKALAGMCEVKFNNAKGGKGPKLLDCFLGMAASELTNGTMAIALRDSELHCMDPMKPGKPTVFDLRLVSKFVMKASKGRNAVNIFIDGMTTQNYITLTFGTKEEMKSWVGALRLNMALAKEHTPMVMVGSVKKAPTSNGFAAPAAYKSRYMTLCGNLLKYYENESMKVLKGMVWLDKHCSVSRVSAKEIEVKLGANQGGKVLRFAAPTEEEADQWMQAVSTQLEAILKNYKFDARNATDVAAVSVDQSALIEEWRETDEWETDSDQEGNDDESGGGGADGTQYEEIEEWVLRELDPMDQRGLDGGMTPKLDADGFSPRFENEAQRLHYETLYVQFMLERGRKMLELIFMTPAGETVLNGEAIADAKRDGVYVAGFAPDEVRCPR
eukprot:INCI16007.3.p1 GENE.INCI16007.3~~INCI16007.3.p1  ORF type:complete len:819 (+),score=185.80 INCI16007.3:269-2725(+)